MNSSSSQTPLSSNSVGVRAPVECFTATNPNVDSAFIADAGVAAVRHDGLKANDPPAGSEELDSSAQVKSKEESQKHEVGCICKDCVTAAAIEEERKRLFNDEFPEAEFHPDADCARDRHIWSELDLQLHHLRCCRTSDEGDLLRRAYRKCHYEKADGKPGYWQNGMNWDGYDCTASIIACSSYERRRDFTLCGLHNRKGESPSCGDRLLCRRCCYNLLAEPALLEFGDCFSADKECYFIVTSLSREPDERKRIIFKDLTKSEMDQIKIKGLLEQGSLDNYGISFESPDDLTEAGIYWEIFGDSIHETTGRNRPFSGAFGGPELSVRFLPLAVLPHANYIAWSPGLYSDDARKLRRIIREKMRGCRRIKSNLFPNIAVYRIQSPEDLRTVIRYIFKPIALADAYRLAALKLEYQPDGMAELNQHVNIFFESLPLVFRDMDRMNRYGICSPSHAKPIGFVTEERLKRRENDAERRERKKKETAEIKKLFPEFKPYKRKKSKQEKWDETSMRIAYRKFMQTGEVPKWIPKRLRRQVSHSGPH